MESKKKLILSEAPTSQTNGSTGTQTNQVNIPAGSQARGSLRNRQIVSFIYKLLEHPNSTSTGVKSPSQTFRYAVSSVLSKPRSDLFYAVLLELIKHNVITRNFINKEKLLRVCDSIVYMAKLHKPKSSNTLNPNRELLRLCGVKSSDIPHIDVPQLGAWMNCYELWRKSPKEAGYIAAAMYLVNDTDYFKGDRVLAYSNSSKNGQFVTNLKAYEISIKFFFEKCYNRSINTNAYSHSNNILVYNPGGIHNNELTSDTFYETVKLVPIGYDDADLSNNSIRGWMNRFDDAHQSPDNAKNQAQNNQNSGNNGNNYTVGFGSLSRPTQQAVSNLLQLLNPTAHRNSSNTSSLLHNLIATLQTIDPNG